MYEQYCTFIVNDGVTIANSGTIIVQSDDGDDPGFDMFFGICNFGRIANSGTVNVENRMIYSWGILNLGTINNSDTINISNAATSYGIFNWFDTSAGSIRATLANTGSINIKNSGDSSIGLSISSASTVTNSGTITVGDSNATANNETAGIQVNTRGIFINELSGILNNNPNSSNNGVGVHNSDEGTIIKYGVANNTGKIVTRGLLMLNHGTINNGTSIKPGSLVSSRSENLATNYYITSLGSSHEGILVNYGTIDNTYGTIDNSELNCYNLGGICEGANGCETFKMY